MINPSWRNGVFSGFLFSEINTTSIVLTFSLLYLIQHTHTHTRVYNECVDFTSPNFQSWTLKSHSKREGGDYYDKIPRMSEFVFFIAATIIYYSDIGY